MAPEYIAKKSAWRAFTPFRILFIWLIIPLFLIIYDIVKLKSETIAFYSNKVVQRRGILSKNRKKAVFIGVLGVDVYQSLFGRLFNYGDVILILPANGTFRQMELKILTLYKNILKHGLSEMTNTHF